MEAELEAIRDAWSKDTGDGRDDEGARQLADAYVAAHPELYGGWDEKPLEDLVDALGIFRQAQMETEQWRVETYLLHRFASQDIGGPVTARIRIPGTRG